MVRTIYALADPVSGSVRYVGVSNNLRRRMYKHNAMPAADDFSHRSNWVRSLLKKELKPSVIVLEEVKGDAWIASEQKWIAHFRQIGCDLTNATDGGDGVRGWKPTGIDLERLRRNGSIPKPSGFGKKISNTMKGRKPVAAIQARSEKAARGELRLSDKQKKAIRQQLLDQPKEKCAYCDRIIALRNMGQHIKHSHLEVTEMTYTKGAR